MKCTLTHTQTHIQTHTHMYVHTHTQPAEEVIQSLVGLVSKDTQLEKTVVVYLLSEALSRARDINNTEEFSQVTTVYKASLYLNCYSYLTIPTECAGGIRQSD